MHSKHTSQQLSWLIRRHAVEMTHLSGGSHIGAILSVADIVGVLYAEVMRHRPAEPKWEERDRFILSKGHAGASIYAALAESGFFPVEELKTHYQNGSRLSGHVSHHLPGVDFSTGSLGHGLSVGAGMALAAKMSGKKYRVFVVLGDGECDEGSVWEAALFSQHFGLDNLVAIIDHNGMQSLDWCDKTLKISPFAEKWRAFGWDVQEIDGHDHAALQTCLSTQREAGKPSMVIANTVKGKGIPFMENDILWHYRFPHDGWEYDQAVNALHAIKPLGVEDPYTLQGIRSPQEVPREEMIPGDHTMSATYKPSFY